MLLIRAIQQTGHFGITAIRNVAIVERPTSLSRRRTLERCKTACFTRDTCSLKQERHSGLGRGDRLF